MSKMERSMLNSNENWRNTLARIPETLGMKEAIYIPYDFKAGESLTTHLFKQLGRVYPARHSGESPEDYPS
jgi:hypothetical protein